MHADADSLAAAEARALDHDEYEDPDTRRTKTRRTRGTAEACTLPCERGLPRTGADAFTLAKYQADRTARLAGGFDPLSVTRAH